MVTWLQVMLQFKIQLANLTQPSLVERINFLSGQPRNKLKGIFQLLFICFCLKVLPLTLLNLAKG